MSKKRHEKKEHKKEHKAMGGECGEPKGDVPMKKGGKVAKAEGHKPKHRLDRARGGRTMTPKSPMSGAAPSKMRPGFSEKNNIGKEDN